MMMLRRRWTLATAVAAMFRVVCLRSCRLRYPYLRRMMSRQSHLAMLCIGRWTPKFHHLNLVMRPLSTFSSRLRECGTDLTRVSRSFGIVGWENDSCAPTHSLARCIDGLFWFDFGVVVMTLFSSPKPDMLSLASKSWIPSILLRKGKYLDRV